MTTVGKIFVVVTTCLALIFLAFSITVFATHKNWRDQYQTAQAELGKANTEKSALVKQNQELQASLTDALTKRQEEINTYKTEMTDVTKNYQNLLARYNQAVTERARLESTTQAALTEAASRRDEIMTPQTGLRDLNERLRGEKETALKNQFDAEQKQIELQSQVEILERRRQELTERVGQLAGFIQSKGFSSDPETWSDADKEGIAKTAPDVEGVIREVHNEGPVRYARISLGSDHGLKRGHRLEIFRKGNDSGYLGKIELTEVDPNQAVGRILPLYEQRTVREGDLVASKVTK